MHPLPQSLADIEPIRSLYYLKTRDKVLLAEPASETVVAEITQARRDRLVSMRPAAGTATSPQNCRNSANGSSIVRFKSLR
jgi:hypothetical protein